MTRWHHPSAFVLATARQTLSRLASPVSFNDALWTFVLLCLFLSPMASAAPVTLAWDPVQATDLAGYKIYYGYASRTYGFSVDVGKVTNAALSGINAAKVYYFAATAYDLQGNESAYSNEVVYDLSAIDTDGDGLSDWDEISVYKTDPYNPDTDGDGLSDGDEVKIYGTAPANADTDGDGVSDGAEVTQGSDPKDAASTPTAPQPSLPEIPRSQMRVVFVDSEELTREDGRATNVLDADRSTIWHTEWATTSPKHPHEIVLWLGGDYEVGGFTYLPRQDGSQNGTVAKYSFYVSADGVNWGEPVASGKFARNTKKKQVLFPERPGQFVRFVALSEINGNPWTSAAEMRILGTPTVVPPLQQIPQSQMRVVSVDSEELAREDGSADNVLDGRPNTIWHTEWVTSAPTHPHMLVLDLGGAYEVWGLRYLPRQDGSPNGMVGRYSIYVSADGVKWGYAVANGTFAHSATEQEVIFQGRVGRFVRFVAQSEVNGNPWTSAAEINILGVPRELP